MTKRLLLSGFAPLIKNRNWFLMTRARPKKTTEVSSYPYALPVRKLSYHIWARSMGMTAFLLTSSSLAQTPIKPEPNSNVRLTPLEDPEISRPLEPLSQFSLSPETGPNKPSQNLEDIIHYRYEVSGLENTGLKDRYKGLSLLEADKGKANGFGMLGVRLANDESILIKLLQSIGYYDAQVQSVIEPDPKDQNSYLVAIGLDRGGLYHLSSVTIDTGHEGLTPDLATQLGLKSGDALVASTTEDAENTFMTLLSQQGYPFAVIKIRDVELDHTTHGAAYRLPIELGPRCVFGDIITPAPALLSAHHLTSLARFKKSDLYDQRLSDDWRQAMIATGLLRSLVITPIDSGIKTPQGLSYVTMSVAQAPAKLRTLSGEVGYSTGQGAHFEAKYSQRNQFPPEGAMIYNLVAGTQEQSLGANMQRSNAVMRDQTQIFGLNLDNQNTATYRSASLNALATLSRQSTPLWQKRWTWMYGLNWSLSRERALDPLTGLEVTKDYDIVTAPLQLGYDHSNSWLDPQTGFRLSGQLSPQYVIHNAQASNLRAQWDMSAYQGLGLPWVLALRTRIGALLGGDFADLAPTQRLFAGGGGSVRGFSYQALGPRDMNNNPTGGRSLNEASAELRYRFGDYGLVAFVDTGQVYGGLSPNFTKLRTGIGIGGRMFSSLGPLRIDMATPLDRHTGEAPLTLYVGIGQAF